MRAPVYNCNSNSKLTAMDEFIKGTEITLAEFKNLVASVAKFSAMEHDKHPAEFYIEEFNKMLTTGEIDFAQFNRDQVFRYTKAAFTIRALEIVRGY
jgi:hypothetical protein